MKTIALYMRLSNEDAHEGESCSIANQRALLTDYVQSHREFDGWNVLEFCDDGYSGVSFERPGLQKLLALAGGVVNCIIVKDFSRFGRNLVEVGDYLDQIFPFLGVRFIAVNEGYDSGQGQGSSVSLEVSLKALVYEMYSRDVSEKIRSVKHAKMRKGEYQGMTAFYGYKRSDGARGKLEVDKPAAEVVRRIFRMAADGISPTDIAVTLNRDGIPSPLMYRRENHTDGGHSWRVAGDTVCWTRENVRRTLCDERYTGRLISHVRAKEDVSSKAAKILPEEEWIIAENAHEAIISEEMFELVQRGLRHCRHTKKPTKPYRRFRGIVKCAHCGRTLTRNNGKKPYYYCVIRRVLPETPCAEVSLEESRLEEVLTQAIRIQVQLAQYRGEVQRSRDVRPSAEVQRSRDAQSDGDAWPGGQREEDILREKIQECRRVLERCRIRHAAAYEDYAEGRLGKQAYLSRKQEISGQQEKAARNYEELSRRLAEAEPDRGKGAVYLGQYIFANELTREILEEFVKAVKVSGKDAMEIVWNFRE